MKNKEVKKTTIKAEGKDSFVIRMKGHLPICLDAKQFQSLKDAFSDWSNWEAYSLQ